MSERERERGGFEDGKGRIYDPRRTFLGLFGAFDRETAFTLTLSQAERKFKTPVFIHEISLFV